MQLLRPFRFKFNDSADIATHGDGWWVYDEEAITALPARRLIEIEQTTGMPLIQMMQGVRSNDTAATLAAMWVALGLAGRTVAWDDFNPLVLRVEWEQDPGPLDSGEAPVPDSGSSPDPAVSTESPSS